MHPLYLALPGPYVRVLVTRGALVVHRHTYAPPHCRTSQDPRTMILLSVSLWNDVLPRIPWCGTGGFQEQIQCILIGLAGRSLLVSYCFPFLFFHYMGWCCGARVFGQIGSESLSPSLALPTFLNNNNNNNNNNNSIDENKAKSPL